MKYSVLLIASLAFLSNCKKETTIPSNVVPSNALYVPPVATDQWATTTPESLGWKTSFLPALYDYLSAQQTRAFLVLKNGKIVIEKYFGQSFLGATPFTQNSQWYWASAGKTLRGFVVGEAQQEGFLDINRNTSAYLGTGWTSLPSPAENRITIRHQLSMTTGLDDATGNGDDVTPGGLLYKADAGTRWAYHNAPTPCFRKWCALLPRKASPTTSTRN